MTAIADFKIVEGHVRCSRCGKRVSPDVKVKGNYGLVVRAWVECPECIEAEPDYQRLLWNLVDAYDACFDPDAPTGTADRLGKALDAAREVCAK